MNLLIVLTIVLLGYAWLLYPLVLPVLALRRKRGATPEDGLEGATPWRVAVLVSAHNESEHLDERIRNVLEQDYSREHLRLLIGLDGCSDNSREVAERWGRNDPRVRVVTYAENRGKIAVLKALVALCDRPGELFEEGLPDALAFTDANTAFRQDALRRLIAPLMGEGIGGVCGRLVFTAEKPFARDAHFENPAQEGAYWLWESRMKLLESRLDSCLGANGAIYAIRRPLFWRDVPDNTIIDDFVLGAKVREQGWRMVYNPHAIALEQLPHIRHEWTRRVRIGAGDYQALVLCRRCLRPALHWFAWCFWSHKVLRWFTPQLAIVLFVAATWRLILWHGWTMGTVLATAVMVGFAASGLLAVAGRASAHRVRGIARLSELAHHFVTMQAALFVGFLRYMKGDVQGAWVRTPRE